VVRGLAGEFAWFGAPIRRSKGSVFVSIVRIVLRAGDPNPPKDTLEVVKTALVTPFPLSEPMEPMVIERFLLTGKLGEK
jgi:hypothetical protein